MRSLIATTAIAAAALLTVPAPSAEAGGLFYRDRAPVYYAPPAQSTTTCTPGSGACSTGSASTVPSGAIGEE